MRESGCYWVRFSEGWKIMLFHNNKQCPYWQDFGTENCYDGIQPFGFLKIDERKIERKE